MVWLHLWRSSGVPFVSSVWGAVAGEGMDQRGELGGAGAGGAGHRAGCDAGSAVGGGLGAGGLVVGEGGQAGDGQQHP